MSTAPLHNETPAPVSSTTPRPAPPAIARNPNDASAPDVVKALREDGTLDPANDPRISDADVVALYRAMIRARLLDERLVTLQRQGRIGFHIGSLGEEASILGTAYAL